MFKFFANTETAQAKKIAQNAKSYSIEQVKALAEKSTDITVKTIMRRELAARGIRL